MNKIPEIPLVMNPMTPEARGVIGFKWNDEAGKGHKIGGEPGWIQGDETPECSQCFTGMTFYGQLDCLGDEVALGDCGRIFVFVCMDCLNTQSVLQCG
ncbi:MAG: hypothetical protein K0Q55_3008 [Verrucomicrobia bacterium]|jgi:hypothetical protein|nr:hypothetical protein [Verrucomicrobiota bacterium]